MSAMEWFQTAMFANLAYVRWAPENTFSQGDVVDAAVRAGRVATRLGESVFGEPNAWSIPSYHPNDESGFAANIFQSNSETVLAIRGTEANLIEALPFVGDTGLQDLIRTDLIDIGIAGFALEQTVSLANYVMRLQAGTTDTGVAQITLHSKVVLADQDPGIALPYIRISGGAGPIGTDTYFWLEEGQPATGLGILDEGAATVTGHSLGGHLAVLAIRLFPDLFEEAVTFNAPGFDPVTSLALTDQFVTLIGQALGITPAATFGDVADRVTAIESEGSAPGDDPSLVASLLTGIPVGESVQIHTERNSHSMDQLMDDLAVHALVSRLNPDLELEQLHRFYDGAASTAGSTDESILQSLARVILGTTPILDHVDAGLVSHGDFGRRSTIHELVFDLTAAIDSMGLTLEPLWELSAAELANMAVNAAEYRVALFFLDPFIIRGSEAIYSNLADDMDVAFDSQSADYWMARSQMLLAMIDHGIADGDIGDATDGVTTYADQESGSSFDSPMQGSDSPILVAFAWGTESSPRELSGTEGNDALFGGMGVDRLQGGTGMDRLDGGGGHDILIGGGSAGSADDEAADVLAGGAGLDAYIGGNGDVILDSDRRVASIVLNGYSMSQTYVRGTDNVYRSEDGIRTLTIEGGDAYLSLVDVAAPATMVIRNFLPLGTVLEDGAFSITLVIPGQESGPGMTFDTIGTDYDDHPWSTNSESGSLTGSTGSDGIAGLSGDDYIVTLTGSDVADGGPGNDFIINQQLFAGATDTQGDTFLGGAGDDLLSGNGGGDWLIGADGRDVMQGASADDLLEGGSGDDLILGGYGADVIYGGSGDDEILADEPSRNAPASTWASLGSSPWAVDLLDQEPVLVAGNVGLSGDDLVWGGFGQDAIEGGGGTDFLYGESGDDHLSGGYGDDVLEGGDGYDALDGEYGDDLLIGAAHADFLFGNVGADILYGGSGDDRLRGGPGDDLLVGGTGNDRYYFEEYEGWDVIREVNTSAGDANSIFMPHGQSALDYQVSRNGNDLNMIYADEESGIVLEGWFTAPQSILFNVHFDDAIWNRADLDALAVGQGTQWDDILYGSDAGDTLLARGGEDEVFGGDGDDMIFGGSGHDYLEGSAGDDILNGGSGGDFFDGGAGDDVLVAGGTGAAFAVDSMWGGEGSDVYIVSDQPGARSYVLDFGMDAEDQDVLVLPAGVTANDLAVRRETIGTTVTTALQLLYPDTGGSEYASVSIFNWFGTGVGRIESFQFSDGNMMSAADMDDRIGRGTPAPDFLAESGSDVMLRGYGGDDDLFASGADTTLYGGAGDDRLTGAGTSNHLLGGGGDDVLEIVDAQLAPDSGAPGIAILEGGRGKDVIMVSTQARSTSTGPRAFADGNDDTDTFIVNGNAITIIAGAGGFDFINTASENVVLLLNRGDAGDVVSSQTDWGRAETAVTDPDSGSTISLGGGIVPGDLSLTQDGQDLLLRTEAAEGMRLVGYFDVEGQPAHWLEQLQFVMQAAPGFLPAGDPQGAVAAILVLDFISLLEEFIASQVSPGASWSVGLSDWMSHAWYRDSQAVGGQIAYEYALVGSGLHGKSGEEIAQLLGATTTSNQPLDITLLRSWPVAGTDIEPQTTVGGSEFHFQLPVGWIQDPLTGETLTPLLEGPLPPWLSFDTMTGVLSGVPGVHNIGTESVTFRAVSGLGQSAIFTFNIHITAPASEPGIVLVGAEARDDLVGTAGPDSISGGAGADRMDGGVGDDHLDGGDGRDSVRGGAGDDNIAGGAGGDGLMGDEGNDQIAGGLGGDRITGGAGDDVLSGDGGNDRIFGGEGNDTLVYSEGTDMVDGGVGDDTFVVTSWSGKLSVRDAGGVDTLDLGAAVTVDEVLFVQRKGNLVVGLEDSGSRITIADWFRDANARIESMEFSGGSIVSEQDVLDLVQQRVTATPRRESSTADFATAVHLDGVGWDAMASNEVWDTRVPVVDLHP